MGNYVTFRNYHIQVNNTKRSKIEKKNKKTIVALNTNEEEE